MKYYETHLLNNAVRFVTYPLCFFNVLNNAILATDSEIEIVNTQYIVQSHLNCFVQDCVMVVKKRVRQLTTTEGNLFPTNLIPYLLLSHSLLLSFHMFT